MCKNKNLNMYEMEISVYIYVDIWWRPNSLVGKKGINGCCHEINEFWVLNACKLGMCIDG